MSDKSDVTDNATDVGMDTSVDLIKYRLPYLESELTFCRDGRIVIANNMQNDMLQRINYTSKTPSPKRSRPESLRNENNNAQTENDDVMETKAPGVSQAILDSLSDAVKSPTKQSEETKLPPISPAVANFGEKSFKLNGVGLHRSQSVREAPSFGTRSPMFRSPLPRTSRSRAHYRNYSRSPPRTPRTPQTGSSRSAVTSECTHLHRTKTELEVINQAKKMLHDSGIDGEKGLQQDLQRLGRGLSSLYLTDFGLYEERLDTRMGMCQRKSIPSEGAFIPAEMETTAERHIYMCQIPSLMNRSSVASTHVRNLKATLKPRSRAARQIQGRFVEVMTPRNDSPRRKPFLLVAEKTILPDPKRSIYKSHESLYLSNENLYQSNERLDILGSGAIDVRGSPMNIIATKERVL